MDGVDVILKAVENRHSNAEADDGAHRSTGLAMGSVGPTCQWLGLCFGGESSRVFPHYFHDEIP